MQGMWSPSIEKAWLRRIKLQHLGHRDLENGDKTGDIRLPVEDAHRSSRQSSRTWPTDTNCLRVCCCWYVLRLDGQPGTCEHNEYPADAVHVKNLSHPTAFLVSRPHLMLLGICTT